MMMMMMMAMAMAMIMIVEVVAGVIPNSLSQKWWNFRQKVTEGSYVSGSKTAKCSRSEAVGYSFPHTLFQAINFALLIDR